MKFTKIFEIDSWANHYVSGEYELYRERLYKNDGTSKCDGDWMVQIDGKIEAIFSTLKEAKNYCIFVDSF
mgnify:CR=1 FL=1|tara:strand:+ start:1220 stop:1429 length:210 start_codon:yes stop_codon:yes gene_type:complete